MKIGLSIPNNWGVEDAGRLIDMAVRAETHGFASLWTSEHLINLSYVRARIGDRPYYHPLAILSAVAARTSRIALGTSILVLPFHNPFDLAKYIATLDQISRGRIILGVGVGNVREEFDAMGIEWSKRGALTDEAIDVMQALWTQDSAEHSGPAWSFADVHTSPKPYGKRRIPIWIGGMSPAALRRVARIGDGWHPTAVTPAEVRDYVAALKDMMVAQARDPATMDICMRFNITLDGVAVTDAERRSTVAGGDIEQIVEIAKNFEAAGVTHLIYALNAQDPDVLDRTVDALAADLLPLF